ncbi:hypothetical protein K450DRAFT_257683 [Umbelopsis ramanniana AG]|uniref:N-acetyltransferase domain-containing protein n=1 Tax=Umbelopsis ramanniana AG TaxID=1314678 RepID=A0AAD5E4R4_UMBRA|nr:uncharacterized protein K450DRAFT_257683 [Umbelopsis ramanniana AG]KAI8576320.1 hypothetical protein K450DRAFT_257683 [Umbelopsis ramanniana AG]
MAPMDTDMHRIDESEYGTVKIFLAQYLPYSAAILTWLTRVHAGNLPGLGSFDIYSSQPDLSTAPTKEPVVIICKEIDRLRPFVSTEAYLNQENPVWNGEDEIGLEKGDFQFASESARSIYETSQTLLGRAVQTLGYGTDGRFLHGISLLWCPVLYKLFNLGYNGPCVRYVCPIENYLETEALQTLTVNGEELRVDDATEHDAELIRTSNKVPFDPAYVIECCKLSSVLRKKDGEMVAWACTHADGCIAALHVRPEWRRLGLAQVVVNSLCQKQAQRFKDLQANYQLYNQAVIENFNSASESMFKKLGWTKTDVGVTWIRCVPEQS